jgi:WD40 repeat protein
MKSARLVMIGMVFFAIMKPGDCADPEPIVLKGHTKPITAVAWAANGKSLATVSEDRSIRIWDPTTGRQSSALTEIAHEGYSRPVVVFNSDLSVTAINYWGQIRVRHLPEGKELLKIDPILDRGQQSAFRPDVFAMAFSPDGKQLVTAGSTAAVGGRHGLPGGIVLLWDVATGKIIHQSDRISTAPSSVAWTKDGKRFAVGTNGAGGELPEAGQVLIWNAETGKRLDSFFVKPDVAPGEWASAGDVAFSPDGQFVAVPITAGSRGAPAGLLVEDTGASVRIWNLATGKATEPINGIKSAISQLVFSADGKRLATAGRDSFARIWEATTGNELLALKAPAGITAISFSPDGKFLVTGSKDGSARIWSAPLAK